MKRCPQCNRSESDDTLAFCRVDGSPLVEDIAGEVETSLLPNAPMRQGGQRSTGPTTVLPQQARIPRKHVASTRNSLIAGVVGIVIVTALGVGSYLKYGRSTQINSIAVMPFVNESGNQDTEYLSDGMTETLISSLSQLPNLSVRPRSSVFRYKGKDTNTQTLGKELNVQALLNGRVVQRGHELSLFIELIDVALDKVVWSQEYRRNQTDLVTLQTEIARDVSSKLKAQLSGTDAAKLSRAYTSNPEAYQLYLKGRFYWNKRTADALKQAVGFFNQAIEKDPNYALAYSGLAECYAIFSAYGAASPKDSMPQAKAAALKALEIDESLAEAHVALAWYLNYYELDRDRAEREYRRAIELNPNYANAHYWLGVDNLAPRKRFDEALAEMQRAAELDPLSPNISSNLGLVLLYARRNDEAIAQLNRALLLDQNFFPTHVNLAWAYEAKGMNREALAECRKALELDRNPIVEGYLAFLLAKSGQRDEANKILDQLKQEASQHYLASYLIAVVYIGLGDRDQAFIWLDKDVTERGYFSGLLAVSPELDALRPDPRFKALAKRMNLPE
jgi:TolB-like protein/Tfp pilus assembly protein PilF